MISARTDAQKFSAQPPREWKVTCFGQLFETINLEENLVTNLIVVGDSMNEMTAGQKLAKKF